MSSPTIDFSVGLTDPNCFPAAELADAGARAIRDLGPQLASYPGPWGHLGLREVLAAREATREGVAVHPEHIALFNGSMQAITVLGRALLGAPGNVIVTEELTYSGTLNAFRGLGARLVGIPMDRDGMRIDELRRTLLELQREGIPARFVYTLPTFHNPTATVLSLERRRQLLEIANELGTPIVEDNCYGDVHFEGEVPPSLYALDPGADVLYIGSLSKIFGAGVRIGYAMAPPERLAPLLEQRYDAGHSLLSAAVCAEYLRDSLWSHVERHNLVLDGKRRVLLEALEANAPSGCGWMPPAGGLFLWLELPASTDLDRLELRCQELGVAYGRGANFHVDGRDVPALRLAFGHLSTAEIRAGVEALATCLLSEGKQGSRSVAL